MLENECWWQCNILMIKKLKQKIFAGESGNVFRGMLTLLVGAGLARVIGIISIPILARIYSPEDYGVLALYTSFIAILAPVMTLRYVQAIPLPKTDEIAFNLFSLCFKLIAFFTVVIGIVLALFGKTILTWFNMEALIPWRWLIVLGVSGSAIYELFSLWATRKRQYKTIARTQFTQSLIGNITKIVLGLLGFKPSGIIIGQFLSQSAGITSFIKDAKKDFQIYLPKIRLSKETFIAKYFQDFVWFRLPSQFLMVVTVQAPVLMMAALYNKEATGQLSLAMMALALPVNLIGGAISKAYYAEIAVLGKNNIDKIKRATWSTQKKLFAIGLPATIAVVLLAKPIFSLVFGEKWATAGSFSAILAPFILLQFTSSPLVQALNIVGSQLSFLMINIIRALGFIIIMLIFKAQKFTEMDFIFALSLFLCMFYLFQTAYVFRAINAGES